MYQFLGSILGGLLLAASLYVIIVCLFILG